MAGGVGVTDGWVRAAGATRKGGGVKFDSRSQLAASIQDALGWTGRGAEVNGPSLYSEGTKETQILFSLCVSPSGRKEKEI